MKISITVDTSNPEVELAKKAQDIEASLVDWLNSHKVEAALINEQPEVLADADNSEFKLGLLVKAKKPIHLKDPLNFLYGLAKQQKIEFAVATVTEDNEQEEAVCYFGHEEGRPDMFEIACYIDL